MRESESDNPATKRAIHLLISDAGLVKKVFKAEMSDREFFWSYLGTDVAFDLELRNLAQPLGKRVSIAEEIQVNAREYRDEYIRVVGDMMPGDDALSWWLSNLSEKNPFIFNPFLAFCYIRSCSKLIETHSGDLVIICQTNGLLRSLKKHLESHGIHPRVRKRMLGDSWSSVRLYSAGIVRLGWYGLRYVTRSVMARVSGCSCSGLHLLPDPDSSWICIHSWVDSRNFKEGSSFSDIYFGSLGSDLRKKGYSVLYLADVLPTYSYTAALDNLKKTNAPCVLLEQLISPLDILLSFVCVKVPKVRTEYARIGDVDLLDVVREIMTLDLLDPRRRWSFLCYRTARNICSISPPDRFIYTFENHMWEKMFFLGFRQSGRKTGLIGYAHTIVNTMFTSYSLSPREQNDAPVPDRIIVNGTAAIRVLANSGFPADRIVVGGSLRYSHLWHTHPLEKKPHDKIHVVIAASADINDTIELLIQSRYAFGANPIYRVIVKCHPTVPYSLIEHGMPELPENFLVSDEPIASVLMGADLMIYTSSASAVEAFALGIPVIHLKSEYRIDMNIFEEVPGIPSLTGGQLADIDQVLRSIEHFYNLFGIREKRENILKTILAPPDEESTTLFVSKNLKITEGS